MALMKTLVLIISLLVAIMVVPIAEAQTGGDTQIPKFNLIDIHVELYCSPDGTVGFFSQPSPPFSGALVLLQCTDGVLMANATTNGFGISYLKTNPLPVFPFLQPQNECKLIVNTTLSTCNPSLSSTGVLQSALTLIGTVLASDIIVSSFKPTGFQLTPMI